MHIKIFILAYLKKILHRLSAATACRRSPHVTVCEAGKDNKYKEARLINCRFGCRRLSNCAR